MPFCLSRGDENDRFGMSQLDALCFLLTPQTGPVYYRVSFIGAVATSRPAKFVCRRQVRVRGCFGDRSVSLSPVQRRGGQRAKTTRRVPELRQFGVTSHAARGHVSHLADRGSRGVFVQYANRPIWAVCMATCASTSVVTWVAV